MTHINSREYINSSSISVSDNTDNEVREGDSIFSGIFSVVDLSEKVEPKNSKLSVERRLDRLEKEVGALMDHLSN